MWDLFICHASEDKADVARQLADRLCAKNLDVWYDEYTLKIGDGLRQSIELGLAKSRYGVVVLSAHFFNKNWPQQELDGFFALETSSVRRILPVWHKVAAEDVRKFSPILANRIGIPTDNGIAHVVKKILEKVNVYKVMDHHQRQWDIDLAKCERHGRPIMPTWLASNPDRMCSNWIVERLKSEAELRLYYKPDWCGGTWFVVDRVKEDGVVLNFEQKDDLLPTTPTTTTTTTTPAPGDA